MTGARAQIRPMALGVDAVALLGLGLLAYWAARSSLLQMHAELLGPAILLDLILTAGAIHFFVGVRRGRAPSWTIGPLLGLGVLWATYLVPGVLSQAPWLLVVVEAVIVAVVLLRFSRLVRGYRAARKDGADRIDAFELGVATALGAKTLAKAARVEVELVGLALFGWFRRAPKEGFSHHKDVQWSWVAGVFLLLSLVEASVVHLWLSSAGHTVAMYVALGLHAYGILWLTGDLHALRLQRTTITDDNLEVRIGLRARATVPLRSIERVEFVDENQGLRVLGPANVRVDLTEPVSVRRFYFAREMQTLHLQVDEPTRFVDALRERIG